MKKEIIIGTASTIGGAILIALFVTWVGSQKNEIINSVTNVIDKKTGDITKEIQKERCSRAELAATLLKAGVNVPTNLLISFSSIDSEFEARKVFEQALIKSWQDIEQAEKMLKIVKRYKSQELKYAYLSEVKKGHTILAFSKGNYQNRNKLSRYPLSFKDEKGEFKVMTVDVVDERGEILEVLKHKNLQASDMIFLNDNSYIKENGEPN